MDISKLTQNLTSGLAQQNAASIATLSRALNLTLGQSATATVVSIEDVTPAERELLLKQTLAALTAAQKQPPEQSPKGEASSSAAKSTQESVPSPTPTAAQPVKTVLERLVQQQKMIESPQLKWVHLEVNGKPQITYSDRPLIKGQRIAIQLQSPQTLVELDEPAPADAPKSPPPSLSLQPKAAATEAKAPNLALINATALSTILENNLVPNSQLLKIIRELIANNAFKSDALLANTQSNSTLAAASLKAKSVSTNNEQLVRVLSNNTTSLMEADTPNMSSAATSKDLLSNLFARIKQTGLGANSPATALIGEKLRQLLPLQDSRHQLLGAAIAITQLPASVRSVLIPVDVQETLHRLANQLRTATELSQPNVLRQVIHNSGLFLENKLSQYLTKNDSPSADAIKPQPATANSQTKSSASAANASTIPAKLAIDPVKNVLNSNIKGILLQLVAQSTQALSPAQTAPHREELITLLQQLPNSFAASAIVGTTITNDANKSALFDLGVFVQQLFHKSAKELTNKEWRTQLLTHLQQQGLHSLAKIQLQQLQQLHELVEKKETSSSHASWQLDIPVRFSQGEQHLVHHLPLHITRDWVDDPADQAEKITAKKIKLWSVTLRFDLPTLGEFSVHLTIVHNQISATFWAAKEKTFAEVHKHMESLRSQFEREGVNVKELLCIRGTPPATPSKLHYSLIDTSS